MTQINWLHLTDLHVGMREQGHLLPAIKDGFRTDLKKLHNKSGPWDLVIFTGDLTQRASPEQFVRFDELLDELWIWFKELGSTPRLVTVPGNHDLVRPRPNDPAVVVLSKWEDNDKVHEEFWSEADSPYRAVVDAAFANYMHWWEKSPHKLAGQRGLLPGDFSSTFTKDGASIGIVGLNSAYLQLTDEDFLGKLALSARQFQAVCDGDGPNWVRNRNASLLLTHHSPRWLTEDARTELRSDVAANNYFALHMFGHMHDARFEATSVGGGPVTRDSQGASLFGLEYTGDPVKKVERRHGYAAGRLELANGVGRLTVWPRDAKLPGGQWKFTPSVHDFDLEDEAIAAQTVTLLRPLAPPPTPAPQPIIPQGPLRQPLDKSGARSWAVVIGINSYQTGPLRFCGDDAKEIAQVLRNELGFDGVYEIREDTEVQPNRDAIFQKLIDIRNSGDVQPDDLFLFYFSGHGVQHKNKDYLLPINASFRDAATLGVPLEGLSEQLASIGCKNTAILVDACREANQGAKGAAISIGDSSRQLLIEAGIIAFFSCGPQDLSYEIDELKHGSFTYCVLQAIQSGMVTTVTELESYLKTNVPLVNRKYGKPPQQPFAVFDPSARGALRLLVNPNRAPSATSRFRDLEVHLNALMDEYKEIDLVGPLGFIIRVKTKTQLDSIEHQRLSMIETLVESFLSKDLDEPEIDVFLKYWSRTSPRGRSAPQPQLQLKKPSGLN